MHLWYVLQHPKSSSDADVLPEMMFGSAPMSYQGATLKVHEIRWAMSSTNVSVWRHSCQSALIQPWRKGPVLCLFLVDRSPPQLMVSKVFRHKANERDSSRYAKCFKEIIIRVPTHPIKPGIFRSDCGEWWNFILSTGTSVTCALKTIVFHVVCPQCVMRIQVQISTSRLKKMSHKRKICILRVAYLQ